MQKRLTIKKVSEKISHSQKSQYGANNRIHSGNERKKKLIYSFKSICTTISVKDKKICTKQGIMTLLYRQKNTTRCKQRNTLSGNERKKTLIYSFKSICQTITVKDKKICTKQGIMSLLYRPKNTTRCKQRNTLS